MIKVWNAMRKRLGRLTLRRLTERRYKFVDLRHEVEKNINR